MEYYYRQDIVLKRLDERMQSKYLQRLMMLNLKVRFHCIHYVYRLRFIHTFAHIVFADCLLIHQI